ncbi:MAG TPA: hypothetical protein VIL37_13585 [Natronosporangium sp.]
MSRDGKPAMHSTPGRSPRPVRVAAVVATSALLVMVGCTSPEEPPDPAASPETQAPSPTESPTPTAAPTPIEFVYAMPEEPCPPVSSLDTFPMVDEHPYALVNAGAWDRGDHILHVCTYVRADQEDPDDVIFEDSAVLGGTIRLYRDIADAWPSTDYELPIESADLNDWLPATGYHEEFVWYEGCGPDTTCDDGELPTVLAWQSELRGRVGNLEFRLRATYRSTDLPADVEMRNAAMLRDLVLAALEGRERVE